MSLKLSVYLATNQVIKSYFTGIESEIQNVRLRVLVKLLTSFNGYLMVKKAKYIKKRERTKYVQEDNTNNTLLSSYNGCTCLGVFSQVKFFSEKNSDISLG